MTPLEIAIQCGITLFGVSAVCLLASKTNTIRRWGYISGLLSEPFWFAGAWFSHQWGVMALVLVYTGAYAIGIRNHFGARNG